MQQDEVNELIDDMMGVVLTALSSMPARCAPPGDLATRRNIERVVFEVRTEIANIAQGDGGYRSTDAGAIPSLSLGFVWDVVAHAEAEFTSNLPLAALEDVGGGAQHLVAAPGQGVADELR